MEKDIAVIIGIFRNLSSGIFQALYSDFRTSAERLDRNRDENVYQQLQSRYIKELQKRLNQAAEKIIDEYKGQHERLILQKELANQVSYSISEFSMKLKFL